MAQQHDAPTPALTPPARPEPGRGQTPAPAPKGRHRRALKQAAVRCLVAALLVPVRALPLPALRRFAEGLAWVVGALSRRRQRMMERNLQAVFGDRCTAAQRRQIRAASVRNICKTMAELAKMRWLTADDVRREADAEGLEHLDAALAGGKGAILVTAHFGNWEYAGALFAVLGYPMNVIARDASDPFSRDLINGARRSKGVQVLGRFDASRMLRALKRNEFLAILPDQHAVDGAVRVRFLGRPADAPTGPALLALRTGAPVLPVFAYRMPGDRIHCRILPPLPLTETGDRAADVLANTQLINDVLGEEILAHPEQWLWLHNRWRE